MKRIRNLSTAKRRQQVFKGQVKWIFFSLIMLRYEKKFYKVFFHFANIFQEKTGLDCHRICKNYYSWSKKNMTSHGVMLIF